MAIVYLGLGANLGDARGTIDKAIAELESLALPGTLARARLYRTAPIGPAGQPDYFNTAVKLETVLEPHSLLKRIKEIEVALGRVQNVRWGPRAIDIDILIYGDRVQSDAALTIPHAELHRRRFVLAPLSELAPELIVPRHGKTVRALHDALADDPGSVRLESDEP